MGGGDNSGIARKKPFFSAGERPYNKLLAGLNISTDKEGLKIREKDKIKEKEG